MASLVVYLPVNITGQPASQVVSALSTATFAVTASGYPALSYQWTFNNTNLPGATSSTLVISNVLLANLGDYAVLVGNGYTSNISATATLSMSPSITTPYVGATAVWGYSATLSVGAIGTGLLSYQWFQNGVAIADATNPVLQFVKRPVYERRAILGGGEQRPGERDQYGPAGGQSSGCGAGHACDALPSRESPAIVT